MSILKYLQESLDESNADIMDIYHSEEGFDYDTLEDYDIDEENLHSMIESLLKSSGINILSDKDLKNVLYDTSTHSVVGMLYDSINDDTYSFDIITNPKYQGQGFAKRLVDDAINEYDEATNAIEHLQMVADVVNPNMERLLLSKQFNVVDKKPGHTYMKYKG